MPEPYWPKRKKYLISQAMTHARYAVLKCPYCKRKRIYLLEDLQRLLGDIDCDDITYRNKWRCAGCGDALNLDLRLESKLPAGTVISRLERVHYIKRIVWRDETV